MNVEEKLKILGDAAKFDVSCSSSGVDRAGKKGYTGSAAAGGICHAWSADGRCVSLLKVLMSNICVYDCAYCHNRASNDTPRAMFTPRELAELTLEFYRRNYIEGLFLSSAVTKSPDFTSENMLKTLELLRGNTFRFNGYIHAKVIPNTSPELIDRIGRLVDRLSCNIELPSSKSLALLAPQKQPAHILLPMKAIAETHTLALEDGKKYRSAPKFVPAGQTTQMIIGATPDTDRAILALSGGLYKKFRLKRVYFSAFVPGGTSKLLPPPGTDVPLLREHRLYQADFLMRFYGFDHSELTDDTTPQLPMDVDPKCNWAILHPELFPVEVNTASIEMLLRIPGVGPISAKRIVAARWHTRLKPEDLKKLGVVMKRAQFFLTADGKYAGSLKPGHPLLRRHLADGADIRQLSLFDDTEVTRLDKPDLRRQLGRTAVGGLPGVSP